MVSLGLIGGIASGKSFVASEFAKLGARVLDGDRLGHGVLEEPSIRDQVLERWPSVADEWGGVARPKLAKIVFASADELARLEQLTHPAIEQRLLRQLAEAEQAGVPGVVVDAAVMVKAGWHRHCDRLAFVDVPQAVRLQRAIARGMTAEQFSEREARQTPLTTKRALADFVIDNSATPEETAHAVQKVWRSLLHIA